MLDDRPLFFYLTLLLLRACLQGEVSQERSYRVVAELNVLDFVSPNTDTIV